MAIQTKILWGRTLTEDERQLNAEKITELGVAPSIVDPDNEGYRWREWATTEAAQAYLDFANSLNPVSATIINS